MVEQLLGADDDWQEPVAGYLYPKLHQNLVVAGLFDLDGDVTRDGVDV